MGGGVPAWDDVVAFLDVAEAVLTAEGSADCVRLSGQSRTLRERVAEALRLEGEAHDLSIGDESGDRLTVAYRAGVLFFGVHPSPDAAAPPSPPVLVNARTAGPEAIAALLRLRSLIDRSLFYVARQTSTEHWTAVPRKAAVADAGLPGAGGAWLGVGDA